MSAMSIAVKNDVDDGERDITSMYPPPWARDAVINAVDAALPHLKDPEVRARPALDPVAVPGPPSQGSRRSVLPFVAWISVAVGAAGFVAMLAGIGAPEWLRGMQEDTKAFAARMFGPSASLTAPKLAEHGAVRVTNPPVPMPERVPAATRTAAPPAIAPPAIAPPAVAPPVVAAPIVATPRAAALTPLPAPAAIAPPAPSLEREEIAALYERGEQLIAQGEIAAARLVFARAAGAGDGRSALALGASYDPNVLRKLGVIGVRGDVALAREWYAKASGFGSREAAQRIELLTRVP